MTTEQTKIEQAEILLQTGTNEIEIFEFVLEKQRYGINALKVREVTQFHSEKVQHLPMMPHGMMGTVLLRNQVTNVINLRVSLSLPQQEKVLRPILLFCEFNRQILGFVVDEIIGINRVSWSQVHSPSPIINSPAITGVAIVGNREITMLDLESIIISIYGFDQNAESKNLVAFPEDFKILFAEDSPLFRRKITWLMEMMGAKDFEIFENGALLLERFTQLQSTGKKIGLILTDIEMPQMDGFSCCKKIKVLSPETPVIIFSSLINDQIGRKCKEVGANESLNKEEFSRLHEIIEKFF